VSILAVRRKIRNDDKAREIIEEAEAAGNDLLEARLYQRAMGEDEKVVMHNGRAVTRIDPETGGTITLTERVQSDKALLEMIKARMRDKYGDKSEVSVKGGTGVLMIPALEGANAFENLLNKIAEEAKAEDAEFQKPDMDASTGQSDAIPSE
jgi:hypothetical protein